jgi:hypothetical protein
VVISSFSGFFAAIYPNIRELNLLDPVAIFEVER